MGAGTFSRRAADQTRLTSIARSAWAILRSGRLPSRRALAALAKLHGRRLERRWPFLKAADPAHLNLGFDDLLEFQYARRRSFLVLVVGAYDGVENDPLSKFISHRNCAAIFVEPQPGAFARLRDNFRSHTGYHFVNAAVDRLTGAREFFYVPSGIGGLPPWTEQLASFRREHIEKHEDKAPGLAGHIETMMVQTISFRDLLDRFNVKAVDVLQIDAEGMDALLLSWFPFDGLKPAIVHYEIAHMSADDLQSTRSRLKAHGYRLCTTESPMDEMAILI
jgi:FkbM family methyltransferase